MHLKRIKTLICTEFDEKRVNIFEKFTSFMAFATRIDIKMAIGMSLSRALAFFSIPSLSLVLLLCMHLQLS
jgi:hypothetical protein